MLDIERSLAGCGVGVGGIFLPSLSLNLPSTPFIPSSLRAPFPPAWSFLSTATPFFVDQCISLSPPARSPPSHKQDLFLIDASCSIKVTSPPPVTFYIPLFWCSTTSNLPPCSSFPLTHPFSASCPSPHTFNQTHLYLLEILQTLPCEALMRTFGLDWARGGPMALTP